MNRFLIAALGLLVATGCTNKQNKNMGTMDKNGSSKVYVTREITPESLVRIYKAY